MSHRIVKGEPAAFVDVDGTLLIWPTVPGRPGRGHRTGIVNESPAINWTLVQRLKEWLTATNGQLVLWSGSGRAHAEWARKICMFNDKVVCLAKPSLVIDDGGTNFLPMACRTELPDGRPV